MVARAGEAPGKVILIGEHAVVYGHPAIAIPLRSVRARAEVRVTAAAGIELEAPDIGEHVRPGEEPSPRLRPLVRLAQCILELFGERELGLHIVLRSSIPIGRGMGSSAAVAVAVVRGVCNSLGRRLNADQICELADEAEREFHGSPSGIDTAVIAHDMPIYFVKGRGPRGISVGPSEFHFVVADTGIASSTSDVVGAIRRAREKDPARFDSYFWEIGSLASVSREILRSGSPTEMGLCMNRAHNALQQVGVSSPELDRLVVAALRHGALGAKLSGAGRGGAMITLLREADDEGKITEELIKAGARSVYSTALSTN